MLQRTRARPESSRSRRSGERAAARSGSAGVGACGVNSRATSNGGGAVSRADARRWTIGATAVRVGAVAGARCWITKRSNSRITCCRDAPSITCRVPAAATTRTPRISIDPGSTDPDSSRSRPIIDCTMNPTSRRKRGSEPRRDASSCRHSAEPTGRPSSCRRTCRSSTSP